MASQGLEETLTAANIDVRDTPAMVQWSDEDARNLGSTLTSSTVSTDMHVDHCKKTASFRLRIVPSQRRSNKSPPLYIIIHSHQILSISLFEDVREPKEEQPAPKDTSICLHFQLHRPSALVMPNESPHSRTETRFAALQSFRAVAQQTSLKVYIPGGVISQPQIVALTGATYQEYASSSRHTDIASLYGGRGGKVVQHENLDLSTETPPSYDALGPPPPMAPISYGKAYRVPVWYSSILTVLHRVRYSFFI